MEVCIFGMPGWHVLHADDVLVLRPLAFLEQLSLIDMFHHCYWGYLVGPQPSALCSDTWLERSVLRPTVGRCRIVMP